VNGRERQTGIQPNIVLILADDMGFSDIGCFGSEIRTPNIDGLAENGVRFTQMYNSARCCPSRAALLTGLNPHQAGVGHMVRNLGPAGYRGYLNRNCATIAEVLRAGGYRTLMSGKWHVGGDHNLLRPETWAAGDESHPIPTQRGFDRFFGTLTGGGTYYNPPTLMEGDRFIQVESPDFYYTDAISDQAIGMIGEAAGEDAPFFLYVAYTAPHWPLHAFAQDIARYEGTYRRGGWDGVRTARHERLKATGILDSKWEITARDPDAPPWEDVRQKDWEDLRMAVYAAQVDSMDRGIGRIMSKLRGLGLEEDTLVMFLSDNGGCAEFLAEDTDRPDRFQFDVPTLDGRPLRLGNNPGIRPGPADTFVSYDMPWANASNAPFRLYKHWVHEGGIATPFVVHWPSRIKKAGIVHEPMHLIDIMATCLDAAGVGYPAELNDNSITPLEGESVVPAFDVDGTWSRERPIFWEHEGNSAVRIGSWKLVRKHPGDWELYDMVGDRTELNDLAPRDPARVTAMAKLYEEWAGRCDVLPWPVRPDSGEHPLMGLHAHIV